MRGSILTDIRIALVTILVKSLRGQFWPHRQEEELPDKHACVQDVHHKRAHDGVRAELNTSVTALPSTIDILRGKSSLVTPEIYTLSHSHSDICCQLERKGGVNDWLEVD
jgi:hypothetical protein